MLIVDSAWSDESAPRPLIQDAVQYSGVLDRTGFVDKCIFEADNKSKNAFPVNKYQFELRLGWDLQTSSSLNSTVWFRESSFLLNLLLNFTR